MFSSEDGATQIAEAVAGGEFMFLDWFGHIPLGELKMHPNDPELPRAFRPLLGLIKKNVSSRILGRTRGLDGRWGAVQLVEVREATLVFEEINRTLNAQFLESDDPDPDLEATWVRAREAAAADWQWIRLEGHAFSIQAPVSPHEWTRLKAIYLNELTKSGETRKKREIVNLFVGMPFAYEEGGGKVRFRVGDPELPVPMRFELHDAYNTDLEKPLAEHVPVDLDEVIARYLVEGTFPKIELPAQEAPALEDGAAEKVGSGEDAVKEETAVIVRAEPPSREDVDRLLAWGPPEERVRALIRWVESTPAKADGTPDPEAEAERERCALKRLADWAATRDADDPHPRCPADEDSLEAWKAWYRSVILAMED